MLKKVLLIGASLITSCKNSRSDTSFSSVNDGTSQGLTLKALIFGLVVSAIIVRSAIRIVPPNTVGIVFRTGKLQSILPSGRHFGAPFLDRLFILIPGQSGLMKSDQVCEFSDVRRGTKRLHDENYQVADIQVPVISAAGLKAGDRVRIERFENEKIFVVADEP